MQRHPHNSQVETLAWSVSFPFICHFNFSWYIKYSHVCKCAKWLALRMFPYACKSGCFLGSKKCPSKSLAIRGREVNTIVKLHTGDGVLARYHYDFTSYLWPFILSVFYSACLVFVIRKGEKGQKKFSWKTKRRTITAILDGMENHKGVVTVKKVISL